MRLAYDAKTDSLYIHLSELAAARSEPVTDDVVLDFAADGALVGIDVQHASRTADITSIVTDHLPVRPTKAA